MKPINFDEQVRGVRIMGAMGTGTPLQKISAHTIVSLDHLIMKARCMKL